MIKEYQKVFKFLDIIGIKNKNNIIKNGNKNE